MGKDAQTYVFIGLAIMVVAAAVMVIVAAAVGLVELIAAVKNAPVAAACGAIDFLLLL